jgi:hypothetical protein
MDDRNPVARRLEDGRILRRYSEELPDGTIVDGTICVGPADPEFAYWDAALTDWERKSAAGPPPSLTADRGGEDGEGQDSPQ